MREITEAESLEIIDIALSGPMDIPVRHNDPLFPGQPLPWKDLLDNTPVTKNEILKNVVTAAASLDPDHYRGRLSQRRLNNHIEANDTDSVSDFSTFLMGNMSIEEL